MGRTHPNYSANTSPYGSKIQSRLLIPGSGYTTPTRFTPFKPFDLFPQELKPLVRDVPISKTGVSQGSGIPLTDSKIISPKSNTSPKLPCGPHSPSKSSPNSARKPQEEFQLEGDSLDSKERISSLVLSIEAKMQKSGIRVDCTELRTQLEGLRDGALCTPSSSSSEGDQLKVSFQYPPNPNPKISPDKEPQNKAAPLTQQAVPNPTQQSRDWASLFHTQSPSKVMKLCHYPELEQGDDAVVEIEETDLNDKAWGCCLIGYFLDGKMAFSPP